LRKRSILRFFRFLRLFSNNFYWSDVLSYYTGYREFEIIDLVKRLAESVRKVQTECDSLRQNNELEENDRVPKVVYSNGKNLKTTFLCCFFTIFHLKSRLFMIFTIFTFSPISLPLRYNKYVSETFFQVAAHPIPTEQDLKQHEARLSSDRIDHEASQDPSAKRQSFGSAVRTNTSRLRKMTLRSSTSPEVPRRPEHDENKFLNLNFEGVNFDENKEN